MTELSENHKAFFQSMKESSELEQHGFRLLLKRKDFADFFDILKAEGFFAPERNPAPEESERLVTVPYWPPLDYLRKCAEEASRSKNIELAKRVMAIVREVSQGDKGTVQDNSHTADAFAEIIGLLPKTVVRLRDIGFVSRWIGVRFNNGRIGYVLDKGALRSFLASGNRRDWRKALEILRHCTAFRWAEKKREQPVPMVDVHSLGALIEHHASAFGRKLGADAVRLFEERVHGVFRPKGKGRPK